MTDPATPDADTPENEAPRVDRDAGESPEPTGATHAEEDEAWDPHDPEAPDPAVDAARLRKEVEQVRADLQAATTERDQAQERALRARADYDNLVRRTEDEKARLAQAAAARIIERFLAPLEVLEKAASDLEAIDVDRAKGVRMAQRQLMDAMAHEGLEPVPGEGSVFDHNHHEAIAKEPSDQPEGQVIEVIRPGYRLGGRLLRAALVKVSAGNE